MFDAHFLLTLLSTWLFCCYRFVLFSSDLVLVSNSFLAVSVLFHAFCWSGLGLEWPDLVCELEILSCSQRWMLITNTCRHL